MVRAGVGLSTHSDGRQAGREAAEAALAGCGRADAALLFVGPGRGDELPELLDAAVASLETENVVGATGHGVLAGGREQEDEPAVAVLACSGLEALPFLFSDPAGAAACEEIAARLGGPARAEDLVVLLPDPRSFDPDSFLRELREAIGPALVVGAGASDPLSGSPLLWRGRVVASGGVSGMLLRGARAPRIGVTQACRPVTELLTVTRARGHWLFELDGRPALEVYREVARGPLAEDLERAAAFLLVALPVASASPQLEADGYLVRHPIGFDQRANAFAIPVPLKAGQRLALALREPASAREDLKAMLERLAAPPAALGLYFNCCARGSRFFGVAGLESAYLENALGPVPLAGLFGSCELGPIGGRTELLTYTGVLALIDA